LAAARDIGRGDGDAIASATHELYNRYGRQIYAYCLHHLSSREEAEDAVQTTFMNAFRGLQRGTVAHSEQAWLFKIAHNVCLSRQTLSWRRRRVEAPNDFEILREIIPSPPRGGADELIGLEDALEAMPENQRRAILLREWQGLSYREIATELELSQSAVEMLIFRARRALASALEPSDAPEPQSKVCPRLNFGALLGGLKSALTGAAAVKVVVVAVAASTVGVAVQPVEHAIVKRSARKAASVAVPTASAAITSTAPAPSAPAAAGSVRAPAWPVVLHGAVHDGVAHVAVAGYVRTSFDTAPAESPAQQQAPPGPVQEQAPLAVATVPSPPPPSTPAPSVPVSDPPKSDPPKAQASSAPATTQSNDAPKQSKSNGKDSGHHNGNGNGNGKNNGNEADGRVVASAPPQQLVAAAVPVPPVQASPVGAPGGEGNANTGTNGADVKPTGGDSSNGDGNGTHNRDSGHGNGKSNRDNGNGHSVTPVAPLPPVSLPIQPAPASATPTLTTPLVASSSSNGTGNTPNPAPPTPAPLTTPPLTPAQRPAPDAHDDHGHHGGGHSH
jgi:RNA polymerase sigma factor (sigma-70 family)